MLSNEYREISVLIRLRRSHDCQRTSPEDTCFSPPGNELREGWSCRRTQGSTAHSCTSSVVLGSLDEESPGINLNNLDN